MDSMGLLDGSGETAMGAPSEGGLAGLGCPGGVRAALAAVVASNVVTLLPTVLGRGASGRVHEGIYQGMRVAVKVMAEASFEMPDDEDEGQGEAGPGSDESKAAGGATARMGLDCAEAGGDHVVAERQGRGQKAAFPDRAATKMARLLGQEVEVLGRCDHPNVVRLLAACLQLPRLCLVGGLGAPAALGSGFGAGHVWAG
ncbi:hypothetical protein TSOC_013424, partial [Tetrabaena socialis]